MIQYDHHRSLSTCPGWSETLLLSLMKESLSTVKFSQTLSLAPWSDFKIWILLKCCFGLESFIYLFRRHKKIIVWIFKKYFIPCLSFLIFLLTLSYFLNFYIIFYRSTEWWLHSFKLYFYQFSSVTVWRRRRGGRDRFRIVWEVSASKTISRWNNSFTHNLNTQC